MKFAWDDYSVTYKEVVESWLDEEAGMKWLSH